MPTISIHNLGSLGIIKDQPAHTLPPEAWSDGKNVRVLDNKLLKLTGHSQVFGTPSVPPQWLGFAVTPADRFWLYSNLLKMYATDGTTHTDITRSSGGDYSTTAARLWNGGVLGGIPIFTNGVDVPQMWSPVSLSAPLTPLTNWPAGVLCEAIKPFKSHLIALNITKSGTALPHMVKWSHPAIPGGIPSTWDETDATKDAGEIELDDVAAGLIRDGMALRDIFVIYKERATWGLQHVGGQNIFRRFPILTSSGILSSHCVASIREGTFHFVATGEDLIVHDGQNSNSVIDKRWKRFIAANLDSTNYERSYVVPDYVNDEVWFCFPEVGSTWPTLAVVWNYRDNTVSAREIPASIAFMAHGVIDSTAASNTWDADATSWDSKTNVWNAQSFKSFGLEVLLADVANTKLYKANSGNQFDTSNMTAFAERRGLAVVGKDRQNNPKVDFSSRKLVTRIWIKASGDAFNVRVGGQETRDGAIVWQSPQSFTPGVDQYLDVTASGRLIAVRFESSTDVAWEVEGYDLELEVISEL